MSFIFLHLSRSSLQALSQALLSHRLQLPTQPVSLHALIPEELHHDVSYELNHLNHQGMLPEHIGYCLSLLAQERLHHQTAESSTLVWTGPELPGAESRDTAIVIQDLFQTAKNSVLISTFAIDWGSKGYEIFSPLAQRLDADANLSVRLFLNIQRQYKDTTPTSTLIRKFSETFRQFWPGSRLPQVFHDPRSLELSSTNLACLHAKCVVIDETKALITSANFTAAAHYRNIEAGIVLHNPILARAIRSQFETLLAEQLLSPVPGLS